MTSRRPHPDGVPDAADADRVPERVDQRGVDPCRLAGVGARLVVEDHRRGPAHARERYLAVGMAPDQPVAMAQATVETAPRPTRRALERSPTARPDAGPFAGLLLSCGGLDVFARCRATFDWHVS